MTKLYHQAVVKLGADCCVYTAKHKLLALIAELINKDHNIKSLAESFVDAEIMLNILKDYFANYVEHFDKLYPQIQKEKLRKLYFMIINQEKEQSKVNAPIIAKV